MRLDKHETCIKIIEAIEHYSKLLQWMQEHGIKHKAEIYRKCIVRLEERYKKQVKEL